MRARSLEPRNDGHVRVSVFPAQRCVITQSRMTTISCAWRLFDLPSNTDATAIARLANYLRLKAGASITRGLSGFGAKRVCSFRKDTRSAGGFIITTHL